MSTVKKWQVVENVVRAIEAVHHVGLEEMNVTQKAMIPMRTDADTLREVDVLVTYKAGRRIMKVGIQVKNEAEPLDLPMVGGLFETFMELQLDRRVVISTSGFSSTARKVYTKKGLELLCLEEVSSFDWLEGSARMHTVDREFRIDRTVINWTPEGMSRLPPNFKAGLDEVYVVGIPGGPKELSLRQHVVTAIPKMVQADQWTQEGASPELVAFLEPDEEACKTLSLRIRDVVIPMPSRITVYFTICNVTSEVPASLYHREDGTDTIASIHTHPKGVIQATVVRDSDGKITLHTSPALPKQTKVEE